MRLFTLATGLHVTCVKCVFIISGCPVTDLVHDAVRNWLRHNIPEFSQFRIAISGKYLGWVLGRDGIKLSFEAPLAKFKERVAEVVSGRASAPIAILR